MDGADMWLLTMTIMLFKKINRTLSNPFKIIKTLVLLIECVYAVV